MKIVSEQDIDEIVGVLNGGGLVVLRTDTIYGIVARAEDETARDKIFAVKGRDAEKKCIVLIADEQQMWDQESREAFYRVKDLIDDDHPTSVIVPSGLNTPKWVDHGTRRSAFRMPITKPWLMALIERTGPLIAPSANPQGNEPATTIDEAVTYFGDKVDVYVDGGKVEQNEPSHLYDVWPDRIERKR